jgi:hypothetical protein
MIKLAGFQASGGARMKLRLPGTVKRLNVHFLVNPSLSNYFINFRLVNLVRQAFKVVHLGPTSIYTPMGRAKLEVDF